jgi:SAM-dependent methyltransferase
MKNTKTHWETVYTENAANEVSWYQTQPTASLRLIELTGINKTDPIIDVGGGASVLVDHLLDRGYTALSVLDISASALKAASQRLADRAQNVDWVEADIRTFTGKQPFILWHDRAVFHFLTDESDRSAYKKSLKKNLAPGGHFIIATFSLEGPKQCSGLNISQYDAPLLARIFGDDFELKHTETETHRTPWDSEQKFVYCHFLRT